MIKLLLQFTTISVLLVLLPIEVLSQDFLQTAHQNQASPIIVKKRSHYAGDVAALLHASATSAHPEVVKSKFDLMDIGGNTYVSALFKANETFDKASLSELGVLTNTVAGSIYSIQVPLDRLDDLIDVPGISYLELASKVYARLDKALEVSRVSDVHQGMNLSREFSGEGVVVGIIDFGFDYTHPTFSNAEDTEYRIAKVWEQNFEGGTSPQGYTYGSEFVGEQAIKGTQADLSFNGHGTFVGSILAGSGGSLANLYKGVAFESEVVVVSLRAIDGTTGLNTGVIDGINYIFEYADRVGKPAVVNISQGHHTGPHDGTSLVDQAIDAMSGPGRIVVGAVGNEGNAEGNFLHFDHQYTDRQNKPTFVAFPSGVNAGETSIDVWGEPGTHIAMRVDLFNPRNEEIEAAGEFFDSEQPNSLISGFVVDFEGDTMYYEGSAEVNPLNNRPHVSIRVNNLDQAKNEDVDLEDLINNDFILLEIIAENTTVHAWSANNSGEAFFTDLTGFGAKPTIQGALVKGGNVNYTMGELGGTAHSIISVGGFNSDNSFTNIQGENINTEDQIGALYQNSSRGPTIDGRMKPDVTAPASLLVAAENSFDETFDEITAVTQVNHSSGRTYTYGARRGTSFASPIVAGVIALMLEVNPTLTPEEIKDLLADHSLKDNFTGTTPGNLWGHGKINAHQLVSAIDIATSTQELIELEQIKLFPNPTDQNVFINIPARIPVQILLTDVNGRAILQKRVVGPAQAVSLELPRLPVGMYFLKLSSHRSHIQQKIVVTQ